PKPQTPNPKPHIDILILEKKYLNKGKLVTVIISKKGMKGLFIIILIQWSIAKPLLTNKKFDKYYKNMKSKRPFRYLVPVPKEYNDQFEQKVREREEQEIKKKEKKEKK
ncbi:MAG: hypothetical protein MJ232_08910, partial [archaeon]|nr:hypothetical protein [archaeon]